VNRPSATRGICRIDQPHKHNHGFFVRLARRGRTHSAFFSDKRHGGRKQALAAAQAHRDKLAAKLGRPVRLARRQWAEIVRRKGRSGIHGVQRIVDRRVKPWRKYWKATWSPEPYVVARKQFSIRKHGEAKARRLAIQARRAGLRSIK
jgi:hypothetical protein